MTKKLVSLLSVLVVCLALFCAAPASATHLRGTSLSWSPTGNTGEVQFTLQYSQRSSYGCNVNPCAVGGTVSIPIYFGDGGSAYVTETITSLNAAEDYFSATGR